MEAITKMPFEEALRFSYTTISSEGAYAREVGPHAVQVYPLIGVFLPLCPEGGHGTQTTADILRTIFERDVLKIPATSSINMNALAKYIKEDS
jgi:hypothetical protein